MQQRTLKLIGIASYAMALVIGNVWAQINSGSDGSDGVLNVTSNTNVDMSSHPNGIYQYISVNITNGATVKFTPNANNTPVIWLVQSNVTINGTVDVSGSNAILSTNGLGGPGGYTGGTGITPTGQGPGGGGVGPWNGAGGNASYGSLGFYTNAPPTGLPGAIYGNNYLIPLVGGSGGGAATNFSPTKCGGGGGGAMLIAASGNIQLNGGTIGARGGAGFGQAGSGSGGAIRLVASAIAGSGFVDASGGSSGGATGGLGRVRFDTYLNNFSGSINGVSSQGSQFVVIPGSNSQLLVTSVAGVPVSSTPSGMVGAPDVFVSALQTNPVPIVVQCSNVPLSSSITVTVTPMSGVPVSAVGTNSGTVASSTATVQMTVPRGGGYISATVAVGN